MREIVATRLTPAIAVRRGDGLLDVLAENDEELLAAYRQDGRLSEGRLRDGARRPVAAGARPSGLRGSAITGAGVEPLLAALGELLPAASGDPDGPVSGTVFKIERGAGGREGSHTCGCSPGTLRTRDVVSSVATEEKVTALEVFEHGRGRSRGRRCPAGEIAKLWGLARGSGRRHDRRAAAASAAA